MHPIIFIIGGAVVGAVLCWWLVWLLRQSGWVVLGVAGGLVLGLLVGGAVGLVMVEVDSAPYAPADRSEYIGLYYAFIMLALAVGGAIVGAITGGVVVHRRLQQPGKVAPLGANHLPNSD